jgi:hypothetical protein
VLAEEAQPTALIFEQPAKEYVPIEEALETEIDVNEEQPLNAAVGIFGWFVMVTLLSVLGML